MALERQAIDAYLLSAAKIHRSTLEWIGAPLGKVPRAESLRRSLPVTSYKDFQRKDICLIP